ncbi:MAG: hypothetical protein HY340_00780 [Candidatus Kerfeldbacteria bacterium]|nr:hypothetical protein [Candidatus Kerfeldbacteria bacterium]
MLVVIPLCAFVLGIGVWYLFRRTVNTSPQPVTNTVSDTPTAPVINERRDPPPEPQQAADADRDGLTDEEEAATGTKLDASDSDEDGLSDLAEIRIYKSNPLKQDSDDDGNRDGQEVKAGYDPNGPGRLLDVAEAINALNDQQP